MLQAVSSVQIQLVSTIDLQGLITTHNRRLTEKKGEKKIYSFFLLSSLFVLTSKTNDMISHVKLQNCHTINKWKAHDGKRNLSPVILILTKHG